MQDFWLTRSTYWSNARIGDISVINLILSVIASGEKLSMPILVHDTTIGTIHKICKFLFWPLLSLFYFFGYKMMFSIFHRSVYYYQCFQDMLPWKWKQISKVTEDVNTHSLARFIFNVTSMLGKNVSILKLERWSWQKYLGQITKSNHSSKRSRVPHTPISVLLESNSSVWHCQDWMDFLLCYKGIWFERYFNTFYSISIRWK